MKPPIKRNGLLALKLQEELKDFEFDFHTIPVIWGGVTSIDYTGYDVAIHMGLYGVKGSYDKILIEDGAINARKGNDALGCSSEPIIQPNHPLYIRDEGRLDALFTQLHEKKLFSTKEVTFKSYIIQARIQNSYICNDTHWRALDALRSSARTGGKLRASYFIHVPYFNNEQKEGELHLASAVFETIKILLKISTNSSPKVVSLNEFLNSKKKKICAEDKKAESESK
eukprot:CAMPEP_0167742026 /NCGR_PEP_ID=MMETSP0110_2-20121227/1188_1 /TAXON_ID=629695 /ORGANISM="Gymnochlora sp., Strain CCMP2014" /LENGTH=226 /DNA_ID=CAMNT_0007626153 /DNA_START=60 /DNA_END=740 /DNA_ORIENTATION=+